MNYLAITKQLKRWILSVSVVLPFTLFAQEGFTSYDNLILQSKKYGFQNCKNSTIPLFNLPVNSIIEMEIKTDFQKLFNTKKSEQSRIEGILSYTFNEEKVELPIKIKAKGNSRFDFCAYKPLDIQFSSSLDSTIFDGIKNKIFITSQCGDQDGEQWVFKGTESEHRNRLLAEYYIYSILENLETITTSVSLCKLKYLNNEDSILTEVFAFIVEPYEDVAKRCNMIRNKKKVKYLDESTLLNADLINHFITNYDWEVEYSDTTGWDGRNIKLLQTKNKIGHTLPYDFDLNAIVYPDYWRNQSESFDEHCYRFQETLSKHFSAKKKLAAPFKIYKSIPTMRIIIQDSFMDAYYKERFLYWLDSYEYILLNHLSQYNKYKKQL